MGLFERFEVVVTAAIPLAAAVAGGLLYMAYSLFYGHLDLGPEEVGLDNATMLRRSWLLLLALGLALFVMVLIVWAALSAPRTFLPLLAACLLGSLVIGGSLGGMWTLVGQGSRRVQTGKGLIDVEFAGQALLSPRITPVYLLRFTSGSPLKRTSTLMYFGDTGSHYVVYDFQSGRTYKLAKDSVSNLCTENYAVQGSCGPDEER